MLAYITGKIGHIANPASSLLVYKLSWQCDAGDLGCTHGWFSIKEKWEKEGNTRTRAAQRKYVETRNNESFYISNVTQ